MAQLAEFLAINPDLAGARELLQRFRKMLRNKDVSDFDPWLIAAAGSGLAPFQRLARTLHKDRATVLAGIELPWSTGPIEGHITRVKLIKRLGYGRAGIGLLRARITGIA